MITRNPCAPLFEDLALARALSKERSIRLLLLLHSQYLRSPPLSPLPILFMYSLTHSPSFLLDSFPVLPSPLPILTPPTHPLSLFISHFLLSFPSSSSASTRPLPLHPQLAATGSMTLILYPCPSLLPPLYPSHPLHPSPFVVSFLCFLLGLSWLVPIRHEMVGTGTHHFGLKVKKGLPKGRGLTSERGSEFIIRPSG